MNACGSKFAAEPAAAEMSSVLKPADASAPSWPATTDSRMACSLRTQKYANRLAITAIGSAPARSAERAEGPNALPRWRPPLFFFLPLKSESRQGEQPFDSVGNVD